MGIEKHRVSSSLTITNTFFSKRNPHIDREPVNQEYAEVNTLMVGAAPEKKDSKGTTQQKSVIR